MIIMKKKIFAIALASICIFAFANNTDKSESPTANSTEPAAVEIQSPEKIINALQITGNRVIARIGPGKQYRQTRYDNKPVYFNKGDIVLPVGKKVVNGYRQVFIPNNEFDENLWVAVQYLKAVKWDDGYEYY